MKYSSEMKNKTFAHWTVIGKADKHDNIYNKFRVKCRCQCGTIRDVLWRSLVTGSSTCCGCINKGQNELIKLPINSKYGKWKVIGETYVKNKHSYTPCECECGTKRDVETYALRAQKSLSCGCLQSKGEWIIKQYLLDRGITFISQYSFNDCLSPKKRKLKFDFAVFRDDRLFGIIEFQGSQHSILNPKEGRFIQSQEKFLITQQYDKIKQDYLIQKQIKHLYIDFTEIRNIDALLSNFLD